MSAGNKSFKRRIMTSGLCLTGAATLICITCAKACTPASVRPAPCRSRFGPSTSCAALRISPMTVRAFFCSCQPLYPAPSKTRAGTIILLFAPTIFLSAFLLFVCEPMIGKMMLPLLGGAASVWITCLLFFQLMLLLGYAYAHALERLASVQTQMLVHAGLMLAAVFFLPIQFATRPDASASTHPTLWLLGMLIRSVGIPFCIVATTAPLLQNWLSKTSSASGRDPYFLYAVSNAGSLLALLAYPVAMEPRWGVAGQSSGWAVAYGVLLLLVVGAARLVWTNLDSSPSEADAGPSNLADD